MEVKGALTMTMAAVPATSIGKITRRTRKPKSKNSRAPCRSAMLQGGSSNAAQLREWNSASNSSEADSSMSAANGCATAALNYVSMPVKVLFKSGKIVSVMLLGVACCGRHYAPSEYAYMLLVVAGLCTFLLAVVTYGTQVPRCGRGAADIDEREAHALVKLSIMAWMLRLERSARR
mgnify:CR=1 FL=1